MTAAEENTVREGDLLWTPDEAWIARTGIADFTAWLRDNRGLTFADYGALWQWSVTDLDGFWQAIWDRYGIMSSAPPGPVLADRRMPGAKWFPGARLNYAQHILRREAAGGDALLFLSETAPLQGVPWPKLAGDVRKLATELRKLGVRPGDRVVAYMPNIPETMIALFATAAIGAVWASCSPDFGSQGVLDRLVQLEPKVLFCVDGYRYGGKEFDRTGELETIVAALDSLEHVVELPYLRPGSAPGISSRSRAWADLLDGPPVPAEGFAFEQVPFDHPLWILFSSGTTGLPKPIVQGHGGILLEYMKALHLHHDQHPGERMFFFTTTGWMMWNFLATSLMSGAVPVLYDGNPAYPEIDVLWKMAQDCGVSFFGASPSYVDIMRQAGIVPGEKYDLSKLRAIMPAGSPVSPQCTAWFYDNVKRDLWIATGSGGTDMCTGIVGGTPTLPVRAGEIQAPQLGVAARVFNEAGESVVGEVGELVITEPMPSMPVKFWNDPDGERYRETYFETFPGIWRHGDLMRVNARGGCFVLGRADATLNRHGVRIGTAEIYRALESVTEIADAMIVNLDLPGGRFFMPLFVRLKDGDALDPALEARIKYTLRRAYTPRHVPDRILAVKDIPYTLTGKKMEVPVRRILMGAAPDKVANRNAVRNPEALDDFAEYARSQTDYALGG